MRSEKLTIYYDDECTMCRAFKDSVEHFSNKKTLAPCDLHNAPAFFKASDTQREIHVIDQEGKVYRGADAILKIIEQYPRLAILTWIAKRPMIKRFLPYGYHWVASNRRKISRLLDRIFLLKLVACLAFLTALIWTSHLWAGPRTFPFAPFIAALPPIPSPLDWFLFGSLIMLAVIALLSIKPRWSIYGFLGILIFLCLFDQTRWQPWAFQYSFIFLIIAGFSWEQTDAPGRIRALNLGRLVIASTYFFSGLQKMNDWYIEGTFLWLVQPLTNNFPALLHPLAFFGFLTPFIEILIGVGLLIRRTRRFSIKAAIVMHVSLLALLGPLGNNWNTSVWFWGIAMILFDLLLFWTNDRFSIQDLLQPKKDLLHWMVILFFLLLPCLSFFNLWDSYLSSALYSNNITEAYIQLGSTSLDLTDWANNELKVLPYPETRVYRQITQQLCHHLTDPSELTLSIKERRLFRSAPLTTLRCHDL